MGLVTWGLKKIIVYFIIIPLNLKFFWQKFLFSACAVKNCKLGKNKKIVTGSIWPKFKF